MKNADTTWVLVSDACRARLFTAKENGQALTLVQELSHPESRMKVHDLVSDQAGRVQQSGGHGGAAGSEGSRSAMEPPTDPKEVEAEVFARSLGDILQKSLASDAQSHLVLVAPPHFLGLLRKQLSASMIRRVSATLDKDFTHVGQRELPARLTEVLT